MWTTLLCWIGKDMLRCTGEHHNTSRNACTGAAKERTRWSEERKGLITGFYCHLYVPEYDMRTHSRPHATTRDYITSSAVCTGTSTQYMMLSRTTCRIHNVKRIADGGRICTCRDGGNRYNDTRSGNNNGSARGDRTRGVTECARRWNKNSDARPHATTVSAARGHGLNQMQPSLEHTGRSSLLRSWRSSLRPRRSTPT